MTEMVQADEVSVEAWAPEGLAGDVGSGVGGMAGGGGGCMGASSWSGSGHWGRPDHSAASCPERLDPVGGRGLLGTTKPSQVVERLPR